MRSAEASADWTMEYFLRQLPQRLKKQPHIGKKGNQFTDSELVFQDKAAAEPEDNSYCRRAEQFGKRHECGKQTNLAEGSA